MANSSAEVKRAWAQRNKHRVTEINRNYRMRREYGISPERFHEMYESQDRRCAVCKKQFGSKSEANIDHCHATRWVRGLLCNKCNTAIGLLGDDLEIIKSASAYLAANITPTDFVFEAVPSPPRRSNSGAERTPEWRKHMSESAKNRKRKIDG
jgi:hypothetical protein